MIRRSQQFETGILVPNESIEPLIHSIVYLINTLDPATANLMRESCLELEDRDYLSLAQPLIWGHLVIEGIKAVGQQIAAEMGLDCPPTDALMAYYSGLEENPVLEALIAQVEAGLPLITDSEI